MQTKRKSGAQHDRVRYMVMLAMFMAMTYVTMLLIRVKVPPFLTLDVKDTVTTLCGLFLGPLAALIISVAIPLLEFFISDTGFYGLIMNILGSVTFTVTVSLFYKWKKSIFGAVMGLVTGAVLMTGVMLLANLLITPYYLVLMMHLEMGVAKGMVRSLLAPTLLPFNLLKGFLNVGLVLLLYKPLSRALHKIGVFKTRTTQAEQADRPSTAKSGFLTTSVVVSVCAILLIVAAVVLIFTVMGGSFTSPV